VQDNAVDLIRAMLAAQLLEIVENEPGTRLGREPEHLHRMRVATRRARATLRTARPVLEQDWTESLRDELAWLGAALGAVRDLDVLSAHLRAESETLEPTERAALKKVFDRLAVERRNARARLMRTLDGKRYEKLVVQLEDAATGPPVRDEGVALEDLAAKEFERLAKSIRTLKRDATDDEVHAARMQGKRARYAAELVAPLRPKATARYLKQAKAFQDVIGEHQDAVVAEEKLRALTTDLDGAASFAAGRLAERQRERRRDARSRLQRTWEKLESAGRQIWR
jgi:CHAD domain-containing protein